MNIAATLPNPLNMTDSSLTDKFNDKFTSGRSAFSSQGWLIQLRAHHPKGCLLSELLQVHDGNYIVRAMVQVDGVTIATAMAADITIDGAEDQARTRVLEVLGIAPLQLGLPIVPTYLPEPALPEPEPIVEPIVEPAATLSKATKSKASTRSKTAPAPEILPEVIPEPEPAPIEPIEMTGGGDPEDEEMEVEYEFTMEDESVETPVAPPIELPVELPVESSIDLSDAIAQIGAEIDRIGWTKKQGSSYLQETYSKRTRAELTEPELLSFLQYLKSLPAKIQPNLADLPF
jgi:hypothetical protein